MEDNLHTMLTYEGEAGKVQAYLARPEGAGPHPAVIVIHEIFGLNDQIKGVADRFAAAGYVALAPHLYSRPDLADLLTLANTEQAMFAPQDLSELPAEKREMVQKARALLFGGELPRASLTQDLVRATAYLNAQPSVVFYGQNPDPIGQVEHIAGPVLGLYGAEDMRINAHLDELVRAMATHKKDFEMRIYPGAAHAFFNETHPVVYREGPAKDAWERVLNFFRRTLVAA
jgi:carboxymethylenebutenolidase